MEVLKMNIDIGNLMGIVNCVVLGIIFVGIFFIPSIQAYETKNPYRHRVLAINIFLGWIAVLWIGLTIWVCMYKQED